MDWESIPDNFKENIKKKYVILQEEQRVAGWREVRLGDVAEVGTGIALHLTETGDKNSLVINTHLSTPTDIVVSSRFLQCQKGFYQKQGAKFGELRHFCYQKNTV